MAIAESKVDHVREKPKGLWGVKLNYHTRSKVWALIFVSPYMIFLVVFVVLPYFMALWLSLVKWKPLGVTKYVGLDHFTSVLTMESFQKAVRNSLVYALWVVPGSLLISLLAAILIISLKNKRWQEFFQATFYLPGVISGLAIAVIWRFVFDPRMGVLNYLVSLIGLGPVNWLGDPRIALPSLAMMALIGGHGTTIIIFCAALLGIPQTLYDAAAVDGAGFWCRHLNVTLPLLMPAILYVLVVSTLGALQVFTPVYLLTRGGPVNSTMTVGFYIYQQLTFFANPGRAAAAGLILLVGTVGLTIFQFRQFSTVVEI